MFLLRDLVFWYVLAFDWYVVVVWYVCVFQKRLWRGMFAFCLLEQGQSLRGSTSSSHVSQFVLGTTLHVLRF